MALDPRLWTTLEQCGITNAHLTMLVRFFETDSNGHVAWHVLNGKLEKCEVRLTLPGKPYHVQRVTERLFEPQS